MSEKKLTIGAAALVAIVATAGFAAFTNAHRGDPSVQGPNFDPEVHEAMEAAFENMDYEAWLEARINMPQGRMMEVIDSQEDFEIVKNCGAAQSAPL